MSILLALYLGLAVAQAPADEPDRTQEVAIETSAISFVDVMPVIGALTEQLGLDDLPIQELQARAEVRMALIDPIDMTLHGPDDALDLFEAIAMLRAIDRRAGGLPARARTTEVAAAYHLSRLGVRSAGDPLFGRRVRVWRERAEGEERQDLLRAMSISMQAARDIGERWFAEAASAAQRVSRDQDRVTIWIGLWMLDVGAAERGLEFLSHAAAPREDILATRALHYGLRLADRDAEAEALLREVRRSQPAAARSMLALDARRADHRDEVTFRVSRRPRATAAWAAHLDRLRRDPGMDERDLANAEALLLEDQPDDPIAYRVVAEGLVARGATSELRDLLARAREREIEERALLDLQMALRLLPADSDQAGRTDVDALMELWRGALPEGREHQVDAVRLRWALSAHRADEAGAPSARKVKRWARRHTARHRRDAQAVAQGAAVLALLGHVERAQRILARRSKKLPDPQAVHLLLSAVHLAYGRAITQDRDALEPVDAWIEAARQRGAPPSWTQLESLLTEQLRELGPGEPVSRERAMQWRERLAVIEGQLGVDDTQRALQSAVGRVALSGLLSAGDDGVEALLRVRALAPDSPMSRLLTGQYLLAVEPSRARVLFSGGPERSDRAAWASTRWRLAAAVILRDAEPALAHRAQLRDLWSSTRIADRIDVPWLLPVSTTQTDLAVHLDPVEGLQVVPTLGARPVLVVLPGHDRAALNSDDPR